MMKTIKRVMFFFIMFASLIGPTSCKTDTGTNSITEDFIYPGVENEELERTVQNDIVYKYQGPMPKFTNIEMFVSYDGRTVRVEGQPVNESGSVMSIYQIDSLIYNQGLDYLYQVPNSNRYYVVYPIAVGRAGSAESLKKKCQGCTFEGIGNYKIVRLSPRREYQSKTEKFDAHSWHLMPYIGYGKGSTYGSYAFHTPYTKATRSVAGRKVSMLHLRRGAVSGGCKRMAPEHIIEMAHILGVNSDVKIGTKFQTENGVNFPRALSEINSRGLNATRAPRVGKKSSDFNCRQKMHPGQTDCYIHVTKRIDRIKLDDGAFAEVDVEYPMWGRRPRFDRANRPLKVHRTWSAGDDTNRSRWICYYLREDGPGACQYFSPKDVARFMAIHPSESSPNEAGLYRAGQKVPRNSGYTSDPSMTVEALDGLMDYF